jgi:hypothetical protein
VAVVFDVPAIVFCTWRPNVEAEEGDVGRVGGGLAGTGIHRDRGTGARGSFAHAPPPPSHARGFLPERGKKRTVRGRQARLNIAAPMSADTQLESILNSVSGQHLPPCALRPKRVASRVQPCVCVPDSQHV